MNDYIGLSAAIAAHFMIDVYLFTALSRQTAEETDA